MNWSMTLQKRRAGEVPGFRGDDESVDDYRERMRVTDDDESVDDYRERMRVTDVPPPPGAKDPTQPRAAGWHADPTQRHDVRFYDGVEWTSHVADDGVPAEDVAGVEHANAIDES